MKTIIAIRNTKGKGKSTTILETANLFMKSYPGFTLRFSSKDADQLSVDFTLIIEIKGKVVAFESQGNPNSFLETRLDAIVEKFKPALIFCACEPSGETTDAVNTIAKTNCYDLTYSSTYEVKHSYEIANRLKAEHLHYLSLNMGLI